ncbi:hypothetical protein ACFLQL_00905 [Verrucomicrobiota bacterium]
MKKRTAILSLCAYTILLPYLCRLYRGFDWAIQYLPIGLFNNLATELLFSIPAALLIAGFSVIAAVPMVLCFLFWKHVRVTFFISFAITTVLLIYFHHNYDVAADAQAAIGLIFIPIYTALITTAVSGVFGLIELLIRRKQKPNKVPENTGTNPSINNDKKE